MRVNSTHAPSGGRPSRLRCDGGTDETRVADRAVFGLRLRLAALPRGRAHQHVGHRRDGPITQLAPSVSSTRSDGQPPPGRREARARVDGRERLTLAAVLGWCTAIAVIDAFLVDSAVLIGLLITGPLLAALYGSSRTTAITGAFAVFVGLLLGFP